MHQLLERRGQLALDSGELALAHELAQRVPEARHHLGGALRPHLQPALRKAGFMTGDARLVERK